MARASVTYEQVAAIAHSFYIEGNRNPGTKAIRAELKKRAGSHGEVGSPNTIQRHLDQWRKQDRPIEPVEVPQLPSRLASDLLRALNEAAVAAKGEVEQRLTQVQGELDELAAHGEENERRLEQLERAFEARTSERDSMAGQLAERTAKLDEVKGFFASAQERAALSEYEVHAAQAEAQAAIGRVDEIRKTSERHLAKMQADLDRQRAERADCERRLSDSEKRAASADARLDGERSAKKILEESVVALQATVKRLEIEAAKASAAEATAAGLREQLIVVMNTVDMLRGMLTLRDGVPAPTVPNPA